MDELKAVQPGDNLLAYANDSFYHVSESTPQNAPNLASAHVKQQVKVTAVHREQCNVKPSLPKRLGEEFEFDIAVKSEEPDFFADMMPDLAIKKAVVVENKVPFVSSKFEAADDEVKIFSLPNCSAIHKLLYLKSCSKFLRIHFDYNFRIFNHLNRSYLLRALSTILR